MVACWPYFKINLYNISIKKGFSSVFSRVMNSIKIAIRLPSAYWYGFSTPKHNSFKPEQMGSVTDLVCDCPDWNISLLPWAHHCACLTIYGFMHRYLLENVSLIHLLRSFPLKVFSSVSGQCLLKLQIHWSVLQWKFFSSSTRGVTIFTVTVTSPHSTLIYIFKWVSATKCKPGLRVTQVLIFSSHNVEWNLNEYQEKRKVFDFKCTHSNCVEWNYKCMRFVRKEEHV